MNSIKTYFAAHKTTIMLASAVLVIGAKSLSFAAQNSQAPVMEMPSQQQMMQHQGGQMPQGYNQQMPQGYGQQMPQQDAGFFSQWFGGEEEQGADYNAYNNAANAGQGGYNNSYGGGAQAGYNTGGYTGNGYNPSAGTSYSGGADYTSYQQPNTDGSHERFIDAMREETKYADADGNTYKLGSGYDYNYVNSSTNEAVQTNDASVTPGAYSSYTSVSAVDYSNSSSATSE